MDENKEIRPNLMHMARLAEIAERYDDMKEFMKQLVIGKQGSISSLERDLLSVAYKHSVGSHRNAHRTLQAISSKKDKYDEEDKAAIEEYRKTIQKQVESVCVDLQGLLDKYLIPSAGEVESKVFYLKMLGDYLRYMAETKDGDESFNPIVEDSRKAYQQAFDLAIQHLPPTDPIRLGLVLNFSVFYFEIANAAPEATALAKKAYEDAMAVLTELDENDYKDSTLIMELLRENLHLWKMDEPSVGEEDAITDKDTDELAEGEVKKDEEKAMETSSSEQKEEIVKIVCTDQKGEEALKIVISDQKEEGEKNESTKDEEKMEIAQDSTEDGKLLDVNMDVAKEGGEAPECNSCGKKGCPGWMVVEGVVGLVRCTRRLRQ